MKSNPLPNPIYSPYYQPPPPPRPPPAALQLMQRPQPVQPIDITHSYTNINLNALSQTRVATLKFPLPGRGSNKAISGPISILSTFNPAALCFHIKQWLIDNFSRPDLRAEGILRMEYQQLDRLESSKTGRDLDGNEAGWLLLAEEACYVNGDRHLPVTVMGVLVPHDPKVRWFYTVLNINPLLKMLDKMPNMLMLNKTFTSNTQSYHHRRLAVWIRQAFQAAIKIPDSPDFINAELMTDCCPPILDPNNAMKRLEGNEQLYFSSKNPAEAGRDLSDDRYIHHLHPAERQIASMADLNCAEYLFIKRQYFKAFWEEIYRSPKTHVPESGNGSANIAASTRSTAPVVPRAEFTPETLETDQTTTQAPSSTTARARRNNITSTQQTPLRQDSTQVTPTPTPNRRAGGAKPGWRNRVRTEHAHQLWLEREYEFRTSRAKGLVIGWREMGFLDEWRYGEWVRAGGIFEQIGDEGSEDE